MNEEESAQLLRETHVRLQEAGLGDLAERIVTSVGPDPGPTSRQLLLTLEALRTELRLLSGTTAREAVARLGEVVQTPEGGRPEGIWLDLAPAHRETTGVDGMDLTELPDFSGVIAEINVLHGRMLEDR
jgi:hypothetical protein